jgi:Mg2+-importing ATPase
MLMPNWPASPPSPNRGANDPAFWAHTAEELFATVESSPRGLITAEVMSRRERWGNNSVQAPERHPGLRLLAAQFRSPIALMLAVTAVLSAFVGEVVDASIILAILIGSSLLGFWQEYQAETVVSELLGLIRTTARVRRDGGEQEVPIEEIVPGDVVLLNAGDLVPADCRLFEARDLDVDESVLTGESFPASKNTAFVAADAPLAERSGAVFQGTHVVSGTGTALVVDTGSRTVLGSFSKGIERRRPESEFERGVRRFGYLLLEITAVLVVIVFAINVALDRPVLDVLLFTLALAVGLTPQLLPAIVSVTLARGARRMAKREVVVRRLVAIEDFGGMDVLCTDKTGTLTEGAVRLHSAADAAGRESDVVLQLAFLNASLQSGFDNPIDLALKTDSRCVTGDVRKLDEVPYDFSRRRLSVLVERPDGTNLLITKGAVPEVLSICSTAEGAPDASWRHALEQRVNAAGGAGLRCLAVAYRRMDGARTASRTDEHDMVLAGILTFADPVKEGTRDALVRLKALGITVKMITGDSRLVAESVAREVGLSAVHMVTGASVARLTDAALQRRVRRTDVFAEVDPNQKERIILALRRGGASVGYLGDGINDAAALHAADVGISVDTAVDVTRRAAGVVLLRKDLGVMAEGVAEGRRAFANTLKYVFVTTSANFGNMVSMAIASLFAGFLPMLPKQILLLNLLSDLPAMAIATDRLDPEMAARPRRWDVRFIRDFMITFGLISSVFDVLTFALLRFLAVPVAQFRTAWFVESMLTEIFVLLVIRTARVFYRSTPSRPLSAATACVAALTLVFPWLPFAGVTGFAPLPPALLAAVVGLTLLLVLTSEAAKRVFFARHPLAPAQLARTAPTTPTG